jgi:neutral amino acid transport system ATP-binding protein
VSALLEVEHLTKRFGGVTAVDDCSFSVQEGTVTGLIGPNGSGKTTVFNLVTGYLRADSGRIRFRDRTVSRPDPGALYRAGLSRTFQHARVFPALSALDNLIAAAGRPWTALFAPRRGRAERERAAGLLEEFGLAAHAATAAGDLSYGQRKLLEFACALMGQPRLVLLDEPTAGVNPALVAAMEQHVRRRHAAGLGFLIVEHDMNLVMRLCDPVLVLDRGARIAAGPPDAVRADPAVLDAYLGD